MIDQLAGQMNQNVFVIRAHAKDVRSWRRDRLSCMAPDSERHTDTCGLSARLLYIGAVLIS